MKSAVELTLTSVLAKLNNKALEQESCQIGLFKFCKRGGGKFFKKEMFSRLSMFVERSVVFLFRL